MSGANGAEDLARRWVAAWAAARDLDVGEVDGWPLVQVGLASRATEIVCAGPEPAVWSRLLARVAGDPGAMLTLVGAVGERLDALPPDVRVDRDDETLMTLRVEGSADPGPVPDGFALESHQAARRLTLRLVADGRVAAEGACGVHGADAVVDMVETLAAYRRRGLARWVMLSLGRYAAWAGATTGFLAATVEGARLYSALGWDATAPMHSLLGRAAI